MAGEPTLTAADQRVLAAALSGGDRPSGVHNGRGRPAADRLRVYQNNVAVSLADALAATFRFTAVLMGAGYFRAAALAYARTNKPRSPVLHTYGETFPDFLATLPGLGSYPFVPECARLEHATVLATNAADAPALSPDDLSRASPEDLGRIVFTPHPAARVIALPSGGLAAWTKNGGNAGGEPDGVAALVTRPAERIIVCGLGPASSAFVTSLLSGVPLGDAAEQRGLDLSAALTLTLSAGAFSALSVSPSG